MSAPCRVAPFAGAGIETSSIRPWTRFFCVAPFAGAGIETRRNAH